MSAPDYDQPFADMRELLAVELFAARGYRREAWTTGGMAGVEGLRRDCRYLVDRLWPIITRELGQP